MATAHPLPKKLRARLAELGQRLHRMHIIQGVCRIVLVMIAAATAAVLLDALLQIPGWMRGILFAGWLLLAFFEIRRFVRGTLAEPLDAEGLAAAIEEEYPRLGERLTTAVELAGSDDPANGSPELVDMVVQDAETRTRKLDLTRAAPVTATIAFSVACAVALFAILVPLVTVPKAGEHARRFFAPWYAPTVEVPYKIKVTSGDPVVKHGENTTLSALIEPTKPDAILPTSATLLIKTEKGIDRLPMTLDTLKREAYLTRGPLDSDFDYRIVSGDAESEWHHVTVVDPVRLESARIAIEPPAYARKAGKEPVLHDGLAELDALQFSMIRFELRFNRVPSSAWLEWKPEGEEAARVSPAARINLNISGEAAAVVTVQAIVNGEYRLHAETGKVKTSFRDQPLRVTVDRPPTFKNKDGITEQMLEVRPSEKLRIDCTVADDIAVARVEMEYRINNEPVRIVELPFKGVGTAQAGGVHQFDLKGMVKEGDRFLYRLVATDNRSLPEMKLAPQKTYYPENERWTELRVSKSAAPLKEQEIQANKKDIEKRLDEILADLKAEHRTTYRLKIDTTRQASLKPDESLKLEELLRNIKDSGEALDALARDISLSPDLTRMAEAVRDVSNREVRDADGSLRQAQRDSKSDVRSKNFAKADSSLEEAIRKLTALKEENEKIAKERLDRQQLDMLEEQQRDLADATTKAEKDNLDELQKKQKEIEDKLKKLQEDSEPLRQALRNFQQQQLEKMAKESQRLEQELRDLTQAMKDVEQRARENRVAGLLRKQEELGRKARELADRTDTAARTAPLSPLNRKDIDKAADALKNGNLNDAVDQQERAAFELDRLAKELERAVARSRDPREAAKQLERLQEDLRRRVAEATKDMPFDQLPKDRREAFEKQQQSIQKAAEKLSIPTNAPDAEKSRKDAIEKSAQAQESLNKNDSKAADAQMQKSREALAKLAEQLPTQEKRLVQARAEVAKIRQEQDAITRLAEQTAKQFDKQDPDAAATQAELARRAADLGKRQAQAAERLSKVDVPGHEERRDKTEEAMRQAKADLEKGRPQDIGASQQTARRELDRLEQALNNQLPPDELADMLAKKQMQIADAMKRNAQKPDAQRTRDLQRQQAEQTNDLQKLQAHEAPATKDEVLELSRKTENARTPEEAAKQSAETARAMQKLADQLNGRESEADKADRLAKKQQEAADEADRLTKKKESNTDLRKKTQQLLEEAKNLRPGEDAQKEKQKAIEALNRAQQANQPEQLAKAEKEAADALKQLADKLAKQPVVDKPMKKDATAGLDGLPNQAHADEARKLAEEQRKLRDELARANEQMGRDQKADGKNPLEELLKEQEKVAKEAADLAKNVAKDRGDKPETKGAMQAADAAQQATGQMKNGQIDPAKEAGQMAAQKLEQLGQSELGNTQRKEAENLAARQEEINKKLEELSGNARASQAQQAERQKELQNQILELTQQMQRLGKQMPGGKAEEAATRGQQAEEALKMAREQAAKGENGMARESQNKAADSLREAGLELKQASEQMAQKNPMANSEGQPKAGQAVQEALDQMMRARDDLNQGKQADAQNAMKQAADSLRQAAQRLGRPGNPTQQPQPGNTNPAAFNSLPDTPSDFSPLGPLGEKYKGKSWGDLPADIKTQIFSDLKARYGEDFASYIKAYFEQLSERK